MKKNSLLKCTVCAVFVLSACSGNVLQDGQGGAGKNLTGFVRIDGSSTVYPLTEAVAEEFYALEPGVKVTVGLSGTGGGFKKFCRGETDINDASREIKESEVVLCKEVNLGYSAFEVAYDGLAVVVNPENDWVTELTVAELKKLWEPEAQNTVTMWNQIRPSFPAEKINLYGPGTASGTFDYFTEAVTGESGKSRGDFTASEDDNVLVAGIANDKYALGFFGLAYFEENKNKLKLVAIDGGSGPVLPSVQTVKDGSYAPLSRPLFIYVSESALLRPEVKSFGEFYLKNAAVLATDVGYIPLLEEEYAEQMDKFEKGTALSENAG